jgi:hypothetical protein
MWFTRGGNEIWLMPASGAPKAKNRFFVFYLLYRPPSFSMAADA